MSKWNEMKGRIAAVLTTLVLFVAAFWFADIASVMQDLQQFPLWAVAIILFVLILNLGVVSFRLARILDHFGVQLPFVMSLKASLSGHLAGLFIMSIFGQTVGRHIVLKKFGVSSVITATLTAYERFVLVLIGGGLCLTGAFFLIDQAEVINFLNKLPIWQIAILSTSGLVLSLWFGRSQFEERFVSRLRLKKNILNFLEVGIITIIAQGLVLASFVLATLALAPDANVFGVFAATAIISFAASMPITINGWGVRELTAVYTLGQLGVPSSSALAISILVGLCSTVVVLVVAPLVLKKTSVAPRAEENGAANKELSQGRLSQVEMEKAAAWVMGLAAAILVFFQIHVVLPSGVINVNLADPFAVLALAAVGAHVIKSNHSLNWRVPSFNWGLLLISGLIIFAFVLGVQEIGVTQWAFASRLMGWVVLLGYISIGYLLIAYAGTHGLRRLSQTLISMGVVIVISQIVLRWVIFFGLGDGLNLPSNFEGYAGNRNALAFQLLICSALLLAYSLLYARADNKVSTIKGVDVGSSTMLLFKVARKRGFLIISGLNGVILLGIYYTGSLGGLITGCAMLGITWLMRFADRRMIEGSIIVAVLIWLLPFVVFWLLETLGFTPSDYSGELIGSNQSDLESHGLRWETILRALELWWENPVFGAGLGVFVDNSSAWFNRPTVIHSTPVWMLSEFGLFGFVVFIGTFLSLVSFLREKGPRLPAHRIIAMVLGVFALFCLVHDIFYQRLFWFVLGAGAAVFWSPTFALSKGPLSVCHIITGLGAGGAERMLTRLVCASGQNDVRYSVISLMDKGVFGQEIENHEVPLYTLGIQRGWDVPIALWRLTRHLRQMKPDIVLTWLYHADLLGLIAVWFAGIRRKYWNLRCSNMNEGDQTIQSKLVMGTLARLSSYPTAILANSEAGKREHVLQGFHPKKWQVIPNGVNLDQFSPNPHARKSLRELLSLPDNAILVGHVARFHPMKDHKTLLDAAIRVVKEKQNVHFVLIGKDVVLETPFFARYMKQNGLSGHLHLLGMRQNIPELLPGLDLSTLSSSYGEGSPNVIIEAMACGVPCVVTDVGDSARIVDDTGKVVQPKDSNALAQEILNILSLTEDERAKLGQRAHQRIVENYAMEAIVNQYQSFFLSDKC